MPDVAELPSEPATSQPKPTKGKFRFSRENAREWSAKANKARWDAERLRQAIPEPMPAPANGIPKSVQAEELEIIEEQITRIRSQLRESMDPGERAQLVRALDLMLDRRRIVRGDPLPGSLRPVAAKSRPNVLTQTAQTEPETRGDVEQE